MRRPSRSGLSMVFVLCANIPLTAQNLESIGKEKPFSFAGGLSFNQIFYSASGVQLRRDPYSYVAGGNVNLSIYGWSIPLTFSVSNQQTAFSQPFNQYSLHPTYKSITAHVGYTSMSFSPYTVNGHIFLGGALDFAPEGNWKLSALYGRFLKAVESDSLQPSATRPAFERNGYGFKARYGSGVKFVDLIVFRAEDDVRSIRPLADSLRITPEQNLVISVGAGVSIFKHFLLKGEVASSAITRDTRAEKTVHTHPLAQTAILFQPKLSSSYYQALKTSFDYQHNGWLLGVAYERIDPEYRTLGAYYFNNDLENVTMNSSGAILNGKLTIAASTGIQKDNIDNKKVSSMRRIVGSVNANYTPSQQLNLSASYSSFQTYTNIRSAFQDINQLTPYDNLDTLSFTQLSKNASLSGMYTLPGSDNKQQRINLHLTWQAAADKQGDVEQNSGTRFYNINAAYSILFVPQNMNVSLSFNGSVHNGFLINTRMLGPSASVSRSFLNRKFRTTFSSAYNNTYSNGKNINAVISFRTNGAMALTTKHNMNISTVLVKRQNKSESGAKSFTEFTATVGYRYTLGKNSRR